MVPDPTLGAVDVDAVLPPQSQEVVVVLVGVLVGVLAHLWVGLGVLVHRRQLLNGFDGTCGVGVAFGPTRCFQWTASRTSGGAPF